MCGELHLKLNTTTRPIANKYREGMLKRTLKREFKSTRNRSGMNLRSTKDRMGRFIVGGFRRPFVRDAPGGPFMVPLSRARHLRIEHSGVVVVHFSPSRTSRPVVCRSTFRVGSCRVVSAHAADSRSPGRLHDGILTVSGRHQSILTNEYAFIPPQAQSVLTRRYGPSAVLGPGQLLALQCPRTCQTSDYRPAMLLLWFPGSCPPSHLKNFG